MDDKNIPVRRFQLDRYTGVLVESPPKILFLRGPIPMQWLQQAALLPGKALNVGLAIFWLRGMAKNQPVKLTRKALSNLNVSRDAASDGLKRLESAGLISVTRKPGQCHTVSVIDSAQTVTQPMSVKSTVAT